MNLKREAGEALTVGIDIGGTKMAIALLSSNGTVLGRDVLATEAEQGFSRAVDRLGRGIRLLLVKSGHGPVTGIGIGCAGPIDSQQGLINNPYTLSGWDRCDIVQPLREQFGVPVCLENDADAAAFGECVHGAGKGFDPVVMLTFGTGIGGGAVRAGQIYRGVNGEHPELGHMLVRSDGPECYCGARGCLESVASGTAIASAGQSLGLADARAVFAAAASGNPAAQRIVDEAVSAAATAAWICCHTFLPQRLVLGGGMMAEHYDLFANGIQKKLQAATQFTPASVSVVRAVLGNDAGVVGAASIALERCRVGADAESLG